MRVWILCSSPMYSVHPTRQHNKYIHIYYCMFTCIKMLGQAYSCQTLTWNTDKPAPTFYAHALEYTGQIYTYQTRRFPVQYSQGYQYILICYDYESNGMLTEPMNNRSEGELLRAYTAVYTDLVQCFYMTIPCHITCHINILAITMLLLYQLFSCHDNMVLYIGSVNIS